MSCARAHQDNEDKGNTITCTREVMLICNKAALTGMHWGESTVAETL